MPSLKRRRLRNSSACRSDDDDNDDGGVGRIKVTGVILAMITVLICDLSLFLIVVYSKRVEMI